MDILIYGDIYDSSYYNEDSVVTPKNVITQLESMPINDTTLNIRVNSFGGSAFAAIAIKNYITNFKAKRPNIITNSYIEGACFSAATYPVMAADRVYMNKGTMIMIHNALLSCYGNKKDLAKEISILEKLDSELADFYSSRSKLSKEKIISFMDEETFFTPEEALSNNFVDEIINTDNNSTPINYRDKYYNLKSKTIIPNYEIEIELEELCLAHCS